jgi:hypothetical protein
VAKPLTADQLRVSAGGIAYRARQLASGAELLSRGLPFRVDDRRTLEVINNALVESALVNARVLAWFFQGQDVSAREFLPAWDDEVRRVADEIASTISRHLGHATGGPQAGEQHPGPWPIPELAEILATALNRFVAALTDAGHPPDRSGWFSPSPSDTAELIASLEVSSNPTPVSDNPSVGKLTKLLQSSLARH